MLRMRIKSVGGDQCLLIASMLNQHGIVLCRSRFDPDKSWSLLCVDVKRPFDFSQEAVTSMKARVRPLCTILNAELEERVFEDCTGEIHCIKCGLTMDATDSGYTCEDCGDTIILSGGG